MTPLWTAREAAAATGGTAEGDWQASGVSIDSRTAAPGDLYIALRGPNHDGHDFCAAALAGGAVAAMVDRGVTGLPKGAPLLRVGDTLAGLTALGAASRARSLARICAVTGSVGKTGSKEALRVALGACGTVAASAGSLNNHWGVPLSLSRMARDAGYGAFELGMNHPGEIAALARLTRPHVALITTIEPAHLGFFHSIEAIADAKAEIFLGLEPGGTAVLPRDNPHYQRLAAAAERVGAAVVSFGADRQSAFRLDDYTPQAEGSEVSASFAGRTLRYRLGVSGRHWVLNSLGVLAAVAALGADLECAAAALAGLEAPSGRGRRYPLSWPGGGLTLIDESYNASPASVRAALAVLAAAPTGAGGRRVAVLGDMLELGAAGEPLHRELAVPVASAGIDRVFLIGTAMSVLHEALPAALRGGLWPSADAAIPTILSFLRPGDVVTVKGSRAGRLDRIVERLRAEATQPQP